MDPPPDAEQSTWQRFLSGKTGAQRVLLALGGLAGAVLAIGAVIAGAASVLDDGGGRVGAAGGEVVTVENQSRRADEFVRFLLDAAAGGAPVQLDHQVLAPRGDAHFRLEYNCSGTGCNFARLETPNDIPAEIAGGVWFQGCWSVAKDGAGYGADHLDLELRKQGDTCPR